MHIDRGKLLEVVAALLFWQEVPENCWVTLDDGTAG